jgi:hypothetical protein
MFSSGPLTVEQGPQHLHLTTRTLALTLNYNFKIRNTSSIHTTLQPLLIMKPAVLEPAMRKLKALYIFFLFMKYHTGEMRQDLVSTVK